MSARPQRRWPRARAPAPLAAWRDARVVELAAALRLARTTDDVTGALVLEAERAFGAACAVAYVLQGATLELAAAMGRAEDSGAWLRSVPLATGLPLARVVREERPWWLETRAALGAAFRGSEARVPQLRGVGAVAALPLRAGDVTLGAVAFGFDQERAFPAGERAVLAAAAREGAVHLARVRRLDAARGADGADLAKGP